MKSNRSKILHAVRAGKLPALRELLAAGIDPDCTNTLGESVLNNAGKPEIAELLLQAGANPNFVPQQWNPPLHLAAANGQLRMATVLLANGAKPNLRNFEGGTPLIIVANRRQFDMVQLLLKAGANVNLANAEWDKAIHKICRSHSPVAEKIVKLLLAAGADPDSRNSEKATPLMSACYFRNMPVVRLLLKSGANVNAKDRFGCTPIVKAIRIEDAKIVAMLIKSGANLSVRISTQHPNKSMAGCKVAEIAQQSSKAVRTLFV